MDISLIFKIAGIGILIAAVTQILKQTGRDDIGMLAALAGLIIVLMMIIDVVAELFDSLRMVFNLY